MHKNPIVREPLQRILGAHRELNWSSRRITSTLCV
jgi:hypothetical protein